MAGSGGNSHGAASPLDYPSFASHVQTLAPWRCIQRPSFPHEAWLFAHHTQLPPHPTHPGPESSRQRLLAVYPELHNPPPPPSLLLLFAKREARVPNYASREGSTGKWLGNRNKDTSRGKDERDTSTGVRRVKVPAATRGFLRRRAVVAAEYSIRPRRDRLSARSLAWRVRLASRESGAGLFCDHRVLPLFFFSFFYFSLRRQFVGCVGHAELAIDTPAASHPDYVSRTMPRANATPTPTRNDDATDSPTSPA